MRGPTIIRDNKSLFKTFTDLKAGDIICTRIRLKPNEEHLLLDLSERGIRGIPSFLSQLCSRSKALQSRLFQKFMLPGTSVIYTAHDLLDAIAGFDSSGIEKVVLKQEGKNSGRGIFLFNSIEDVYTQAAVNMHPYPFVVQPYICGYRDIRVIIIGSYIEAYQRNNQNSFRKNLHCGGTSKACFLTKSQHELCLRIMKRGNFPYAHIDLMETADGCTYLTEINLRGGLHGAAIDSVEYQQKITDLQEALCRNMIADHSC